MKNKQKAWRTRAGVIGKVARARQVHVKGARYGRSTKMVYQMMEKIRAVPGYLSALLVHGGWVPKRAQEVQNDS